MCSLAEQGFRAEVCDTKRIPFKVVNSPTMAYFGITESHIFLYFFLINHVAELCKGMKLSIS